MESSIKNQIVVVLFIVAWAADYAIAHDDNLEPHSRPLFTEIGAGVVQREADAYRQIAKSTEHAPFPCSVNFDAEIRRSIVQSQSAKLRELRAALEFDLIVFSATKSPIKNF